MNNALRDLPFDHEFGVRHSSVSVQIHVFQAFTHFIFFIWNEAHFSYDLKNNYRLYYLSDLKLVAFLLLHSRS